jgi:hypothetical protein
MIVKFADCIKESFGDYEVSVAFMGRGWGQLKVFNNANGRDVTKEVFGKEEVDADIEKMNFARLWCEMRSGSMIVKFD